MHMHSHNDYFSQNTQMQNWASNDSQTLVDLKFRNRMLTKHEYKPIMYSYTLVYSCNSPQSKDAIATQPLFSDSFLSDLKLISQIPSVPKSGHPTHLVPMPPLK